MLASADSWDPGRSDSLSGGCPCWWSLLVRWNLGSLNCPHPKVNVLFFFSFLLPSVGVISFLSLVDFGSCKSNNFLFPIKSYFLTDGCRPLGHLQFVTTACIKIPSVCAISYCLIILFTLFTFLSASFFPNVISFTHLSSGFYISPSSSY